MIDTVDYFNVHVVDKQINELKILVAKIKGGINECMDQNRFKQIIKNNVEIVLPMMFKRHNIELATIIGVGEKKININLLIK